MGTRIATTHGDYDLAMARLSNKRSKTMRHIFPLALGVAVVASALSVAASTPSSTPSASEAQALPMRTKSPQTAESKAAINNDTHFVMEAADGGMAEVELGHLAADKASNAKVKQFGQQMVTDHGKAGDELKSLAASKNILLPTSVSAKHEATKNRLSKLSGPAFDRAYMAEMVRDHQADSAAFHKEAASGHDADIKAWATKTGSVVDEHLKMARDVQKEVTSGKSTH
jgi:putative membrane protein